MSDRDVEAEARLVADMLGLPVTAEPGAGYADIQTGEHCGIGLGTDDDPLWLALVAAARRLERAERLLRALRQPSPDTLLQGARSIGATMRQDNHIPRAQAALQAMLAAAEVEVGDA